jgi:hypothetical protein
MIALLTGWGLSKLWARLIAYVGIPLLVLGLVWLWLNAYGDRRYDEGIAAERSAWVEASEKLKQQAAASATKADDAAAERLAEHAVEAAVEQEKVNEAIAAGSSPIDVLFP